jgi:natural product biosynthesis luciferase-like monooxygenase protein
MHDGLSGGESDGAALGFGLFFFGALPESHERPTYDELLYAAATADAAGLRFVSVPERHFNAFGGAFPSPAILAAAIAARTSRIEIRAGSVITPLHDIVRVAEDWSVVSNLSGGRCAISIGSGWSVNDFVLAAPAVYEDRHRLAVEHITVLRDLWAGEPFVRTNAVGNPFSATIHPLPPGGTIPLWLTSGGTDETFAAAGAAGVNVLTHLERQDVDALRRRIDIYRNERMTAGHDPGNGIVTVMQHTYVTSSRDEHDEAAAALRAYIESALGLERSVMQAGGSSSGGAPSAAGREPFDGDTIVEAAVTRYLEQASLIGTRRTCVERAEALRVAGATEIACLVDFAAKAGHLQRTVQDIAEISADLAPGRTGRAFEEMRSRFGGK